MLNRHQMRILLMLNKKDGTLLSKLPKIVILNEICKPDDEIFAKALQHAARAEKTDVDTLLEMIKKNPFLLLKSGSVTAPGGLRVENVTIYEFLLGAHDYSLAAKLAPHYQKMGLETTRVRSYKKYQPCIEGMQTQKPYDLSELFNILKKASKQDVAALLTNNMRRRSPLCEAILKFRQDFAPGVLTTPGMHFDYQSLRHAFAMLQSEWANLEADVEKIKVVLWLIIGFQMRRLPGIERCMIANGAFKYLEKEFHLKQEIKKGIKTEPFPDCLIERSYKLNPRHRPFPDVANDDDIPSLDLTQSVLGLNAYISFYGTLRGSKDTQFHAESIKSELDRWDVYLTQRIYQNKDTKEWKAYAETLYASRVYAEERMSQVQENQIGSYGECRYLS